MTEMQVRVGHLYPDLMNLYGDRGNVQALLQRCQWRGIQAELELMTVGHPADYSAFDLLFIGGGQDREQEIVWRDLMHRSDALHDAVDAGTVILGVCGGFQLLGHRYRTPEGIELQGVGLLDVETVAGQDRFIGDVLVETDFLQPRTLVGFENHGGRTHLGPGVRPLGRVISGHGNNGEDGTEGAQKDQVFGTYLHGSLLPKNPHLADHLLTLALQRHDPEVVLKTLDDELEWAAHRVMVERATKRKRSS